MFLTLGYSVATEHDVLKIKYDKYCRTRLNETFLVDQIYDFKSDKVLNFIFVSFNAVDGNIVNVFFHLTIVMQIFYYDGPIDTQI